MIKTLFFDIGETILANADTSAAEAVLIGDRLDNDIIPARRIGMKTIWIRWGHYSIMEPRTPDEIPAATVADVREIRDAVAMLDSRFEK